MPGRLRRSPANIIAQMLVDMALSNIHTAATWATFVNDEADKPDKVITVFDTRGVFTGREMSEGELQGMPGLQFRARGSNPREVYEKLMEIAIGLDTTYYRTVMIENQHYLVHDVRRLEDPFQLPPPNRTGKVVESERNIFVFNALTSIKQVI